MIWRGSLHLLESFKRLMTRRQAWCLKYRSSIIHIPSAGARRSVTSTENKSKFFRLLNEGRRVVQRKAF